MAFYMTRYLGGLDYKGIYSSDSLIHLDCATYMLSIKANFVYLFLIAYSRTFNL